MRSALSGIQARPGVMLANPPAAFLAPRIRPRQTAARGELMFPIAQRHVARVMLVPDEAIRRAQETLWRALHIVAEPGGATALAPLLTGLYRPRPGERIGVLLCGANTTAVNFG